jgi:hypothetical protein
MDYKKHYDLLIERAKTRQLAGYTEKHHILPKCMGGTNKKSNIVKLTPEEHYLAHQLLVKMHPQNELLIYAAHKMTINSTNTNRTNKEYGWLKRYHQKICKARIGKNNPSYGRYWYHNPITLEKGKFSPEDVPANWVKGNVKKEKRATCTCCKQEFRPIYKEKYCSVDCKESSKPVSKTRGRESELRDLLNNGYNLDSALKFMGIPGAVGKWYVWAKKVKDSMNKPL